MLCADQNASFQMADVHRSRSASSLWKAGMGGNELHHQVSSWTATPPDCIPTSCTVSVADPALSPGFRPRSCLWETFTPVLGLCRAWWVEEKRRITGVFHKRKHGSVCFPTTGFPLCAGHSLLLHSSEFLTCCYLLHHHRPPQRGRSIRCYPPFQKKGSI